jgi:hypothetical protein
VAVATYQDVAVALGRPITSEDEQAQVDWWLTGIELIVTARLGDVSLLDQDLLKYVEVEAVVAKVGRAGSLATSRTVSVDDGSVTTRYESSVSASDIADDWWNLLNPDVAQSAYSVRPTFEADDVQWSVLPPAGFEPMWSRWP